VHFDASVKVVLQFLDAHYRPWRTRAIRLIIGTGYAARAALHGALGKRERARIFLAMARVYAGDA